MASIHRNGNLYKQLFKNMIHGFAHCRVIRDESGHVTDWTYIETNDAYERLTGLKDVVGKNVSETMPALMKTNPEVVKRYERIANGGKPDEFEYYSEPLRSWFHVSAYSAEPDTFSIIFDNITEHKKLHAELVSAHSDLLNAYDATISGWAAAIELRDEGTSGHCKRLAEMTLTLCRQMGYYVSDMKYIKWGALLHDIGKIAIPDAILHKPGKLDAAEWIEMKKHPVYAYEMLRDIDYLANSLNIPHYHHERWDGQGYPAGLKGAHIPMEARIFAVVDMYDALIYDRPYRRAMSHAEAMQLITAESDIMFDPLVIESFVKMMKGR